MKQKKAKIDTSFSKVMPSRTKPSGLLGDEPKGPRTRPTGTTNDWERLTRRRENEVAELFARVAYHIEQNPKPPSERPIKKDIPGLPRPDYKLEGEYADLYTPQPHANMNTIMKEVRSKSREQAARVVLDLVVSQFTADDFYAQLVVGRYKSGLEYAEELIIVDKNGQIVHLYP